MAPTNLETTQRQIDYIKGLCEKNGINSHQDQLGVCTRVLGRFIADFDKMERKEASKVIDYLKELST